MDSPIGPLQPLPQQPLISPAGARLVLCGRYTGDPEKTSQGRGRWFDNIAGTDTKTFLRAINPPKPSGGEDDEDDDEDTWPAVVLMPEEYKLRVGGMSVTELRSQLEKYWGQGGIPGIADDGYQDMWVPAWAPDNTNDPYLLSWYSEDSEGSKLETSPRLDPALFSHWVNRECAPWLSYFIAKNHTFGAVHAWFAAFIGVIRGSLEELAESLINMEAVSNVKFRMSFDLCIKDYDEVVDGIPSLPVETKIMASKGMQVIHSTINDMFPRRIWDICANTVTPATWFCGPTCPLTANILVGTMGVTPVSHAWVADRELVFIVTEANQQLWPIPIPRGVQLEDIRGEMIRLGVRFAWVDVLCLRQQAQPALAKDLAFPASREVVERREQRRLEEWKVDVPTIGAIYSNQHEEDLYGSKPTVVFMSGLGRPFQGEGWTSERHWLKRVWTLQETPVLSRCIIAGLQGGASYQWDGGINSENLWPWNCKVRSCFLSEPCSSVAITIEEAMGSRGRPMSAYCVQEEEVFNVLSQISEVNHYIPHDSH